jgi:hypothetical protein
MGMNNEPGQGSGLRPGCGCGSGPGAHYPPILRPLLLSVARSLSLIPLALSFRLCGGSGVATDYERAQTDCVFAVLSSSDSPCSSYLHLYVFGSILSIFFVCNICTYVRVFLFWRLVFPLLLRVDTFFTGFL